MLQAGLDYSRNWDTQTNYQPETRVKKTRKIYKKTKSKKVFLIKIGAVLFLYAVLLVFLCIKSATLGYEVVELEKEISKAETANSRIEYEIAENSSLDRIEEIAVAKLGMHRSDSTMLVAAINTEKGQDQVRTEEKKNGNLQTNISEKPLEKLYASLMQLTGNDF